MLLLWTSKTMLGLFWYQINQTLIRKCETQKQKLSTILRFYKEVMYKTINLALKYLPINIKTTLVWKRETQNKLLPISY